MEDKE